MTFPLAQARARAKGSTPARAGDFLASLYRHMSSPPSRDPLHGVTLERLLSGLVAEFGWEELARQVPIRCFQFDPSIKSSLVFLRRTPWARAKVEQLYVQWKTAGA